MVTRRWHRALVVVGVGWLLAVAGCRDGAPGPVDPGPSTQPALPTMPPIRVLLGSSSLESVSLSVDGPYQWRLAGDRHVLAKGDRLGVRFRGVPVTTTPTGFQIGNLKLDSGRVDLVPARDGSLLVKHEKWSSYRGSLRLLKRSDGRFQLINIVDMESYLASVVNGEMPREFPRAALRAQAIAARTYAVFQMKSRSPPASFDVYDSVSSQRYHGRNWETTASLEAVSYTRGIVLTHNGRVFCSFYSACCGGRTAAAADVQEFRKYAVPPLASVPCTWCKLPSNTRYAWRAEFDRAELGEKLKEYFASTGVTIGEVRSLTVDSRLANGQVDRLRIDYTGGSIRMAAPLFRARAGGYDVLRSTRFSIRQTDGRIVLEGTGWGHGVGMCQWGARGLAENGRNCVEILKHYYPGSGLTMIY